MATVLAAELSSVDGAYLPSKTMEMQYLFDLMHNRRRFVFFLPFLFSFGFTAYGQTEV